MWPRILGWIDHGDGEIVDEAGVFRLVGDGVVLFFLYWGRIVSVWVSSLLLTLCPAAAIQLSSNNLLLIYFPMRYDSGPTGLLARQESSSSWWIELFNTRLSRLLQPLQCSRANVPISSNNCLRICFNTPQIFSFYFNLPPIYYVFVFNYWVVFFPFVCRYWLCLPSAGRSFRSSNGVFNCFID